MTLFGMLFGEPASSEEIIRAFDPWTLACAVGAKNGTVGSPMGYEMWRKLSEPNWMPKARARCGASERAIGAALKEFVSANEHLDMIDVLRAEQKKRGLPISRVAGEDGDGDDD